MKFKVGDRVIANRNSRNYKGAIGNIIKIKNGIIWVRLDNGARIFLFAYKWDHYIDHSKIDELFI